jgi:outer membrane protein OmpA-like peptidoglycan-associated protein
LTDAAGIQHTVDFPELDIKTEYLTIEKQRELGMRAPERMFFELPAFSYNSAVVHERNKYIIRKHILPLLTKNDKILIEGYTDSLETAPKRLSEERAFAVAKLINIGKKTSLGVGNLVQYNPHDPIGRFLNRNVRITVLTPIPAAK